VNRPRRYVRAAARWARLLVPAPPREGVRLFYGHDAVPGPDDEAVGGVVKFQRLAARFPNDPRGFTVLYLGSSWLPRDFPALLWAARRRGAAVVLNQDGVGYPGWAGARTEAVNRPLRRALLAADHVVFQSAFCRDSARTFLGEPRGSSEVLHNAVDVERFSPAPAPRPGPAPVVLLGGDQSQWYRLETALRTFALLRQAHPGARLLVTGRLVAPVDGLLRELGLEGSVELTGPYLQRDAPALFRRADLLLHPKVNDPCPNVVLEAMASGLPVVHAASGGTVELVGDEAGIGVSHPLGWERDVPPEPGALAEAVARVLERHGDYAAAARRRAVERFALGPWLERHAELFAQLVGERR
jgi:glycosyltransferase involved in cell wall biosynthesis